MDKELFKSRKKYVTDCTHKEPKSFFSLLCKLPNLNYLIESEASRPSKKIYLDTLLSLRLKKNLSLLFPNCFARSFPNFESSRGMIDKHEKSGTRRVSHIVLV